MFFNRNSKKQLFTAKARMAHLPFNPGRSIRYIGAFMILATIAVYSLTEALEGSILGSVIFVLSFVSSIFISFLIFPLEDALIVNQRGFTFKTAFKSEQVDWNEIKNLRYKSIGPVGFITWDWADNLILSGHRTTKMCKKLTGYGASFINCYEIETAELAVFFELMREKHAKVWRTPFNNSRPAVNYLDGIRSASFGRAQR